MPNRNSKSAETQNAILEAASKILITDGYNGFTLRKVAAASNISIGNLNYHYPTKSALIDALLDHITDRIISGFTEVAEQAGESPEKRFRAVLEYWIDDLQTVETTVFFPEIWALANHYDFARDTAARSYSHARDILQSFISELNPSLSAQKIDQLAKLICASLEGLTVFVGHEKMWQRDHAAIKNLTIDNFVALINNAAG